MLHPQITTQQELDQCSLIMLLKDSDGINADDPLGVVSLRFPGFDRLDKDASTDEKEFSFDFDEPIEIIQPPSVQDYLNMSPEANAMAKECSSESSNIDSCVTDLRNDAFSITFSQADLITDPERLHRFQQDDAEPGGRHH